MDGVLVTLEYGEPVVVAGGNDATVYIGELMKKYHDNPIVELTRVVNSFLKDRESLPARDIEQLEKIRAALKDMESPVENRSDKMKALNVAIRLAKFLLDNNIISRILDP